MIAERLRTIAQDGIEFPCRAIVRASRCDSSGYTADVETLDDALEPTGQTLAAVELDPLWWADGGAGVWAPPAAGKVVAVVWAGGSAGHPMIVAGGHLAAPRVPVEAGEWSAQGDTFEIRLKAGEVVIRDEDGAQISGKDSRWKIAGPDDDLLDMLQLLCFEVRTICTVLIGAVNTGPNTPLLETTGRAAIHNAEGVVERIQNTRLPSVLYE